MGDWCDVFECPSGQACKKCCNSTDFLAHCRSEKWPGVKERCSGPLIRTKLQKPADKETGIVYGNTSPLGYYYVKILVGTPPQNMTVLLDTGSSQLGFPCKGCANCGAHTDPYYDFDKSLTFAGAGCNVTGKFCYDCSRGHCWFRKQYLEGSGISGYYAKDLLTIYTPCGDSPKINATFGCDMTAGGMLRSQKADGIFGLSPNLYTEPSLPVPPFSRLVLCSAPS